MDNNLCKKITALLTQYANEKHQTLISIHNFLRMESENAPIENVINDFCKLCSYEIFKEVVLDWDEMVISYNEEKNFSYIGKDFYFIKCLEDESPEKLVKYIQDYPYLDIGIHGINKVIATIDENQKFSTTNDNITLLESKEINWDNVFARLETEIKNNNYCVKFTPNDITIFNKLIGTYEVPQYFKDCLLLNNIYAYRYNTCQYLLENGADPQLKSLNKDYFLLTGRILSPDTKNAGRKIAGAKEIRQLIVQYLPSNIKSNDNEKWIAWQEKMLDSVDASIQQEIGHYMLNGDILPINKKRYNKYAQALVLLPVEDFDIIIKKYNDNKFLNKQLNAQLYKHAILTNNDKLINILWKNEIDESYYLKSQAFKNISEEGSLIQNKNKNKNKKDSILLNNKIVSQVGLHNKLQEKIEIMPTKIEKTRRKI